MVRKSLLGVCGRQSISTVTVALGVKTFVMYICTQGLDQLPWKGLDWGSRSEVWIVCGTGAWSRPYILSRSHIYVYIHNIYNIYASDSLRHAKITALAVNCSVGSCEALVCGVGLKIDLENGVKSKVDSGDWWQTAWNLLPRSSSAGLMNPSIHFQLGLLPVKGWLGTSAWNAWI